MNPRPHIQPFLSNSLAIRQEIQRFESVHPSIYAIYDLIDVIPDPLLAQQIREHVVCIEDSFVNSQEWTLSRTVPDLRLGIVGSLSSGKSALVHRYLTGSYMQEESPEGGRFKKEIIIDGQSYLLLIRDEGGPPELQFTSWVDAVIFVFSLENESSFNAIYSYYAKMAQYRNTAEVPLILVGTQDAISENNPRVIDDSRARKLASDLKRCSYYETCATYGLNVERVFQDACQKIIQQKMSSVTPTNSRPGTPNHVLRNNYYSPAPSNNGLASSHHATPPGPLTSLSSSITATVNSGTATASPSHKEQISKDLPTRDIPPTFAADKQERLTPSVNLGINTAVWNVGNSNLPSGAGLLQTGSGSSHLTSSGTNHLTGSGSNHLSGSGSNYLAGSSVGGPLIGNSNLQTGSSLLTTSGSGGYGVVGSAGSGGSSTGTGSLAGSGGSTGSVSGLGHVTTSTSATACPVMAGGGGGFTSGSAVDSQPSPPILFVDAVLLPPPPPATASSTSTSTSSATSKEQKDLPTPSSTPTTSRKARRRSNLFTVGSLPSKKADDNKKVKNGEVGSGRVIPLKQGYLYKRSCKALNKEWKKKYVSLCEDGRLTYHPNLNDYMDDIHGKEIPLKHTTVKIPGQRPRGTKTQISQTSSSHVNGLDREFGSLSIGGGFHFNLPVFGKDKSSDKDVQLTTYEMHRDGGSFKPGSFSGPCDDAVVIPNSGVLNGGESTQSNNVILGKIETPNVKKRHRRMKSSGGKNLDNFDDSNGYEFIVVSLDNKQWHFDAASIDERDSWVQAIEQRILNSLQCNESSKSKSRMNSLVDAAAIQSMKTAVGGNTHCVDCDAPNPDWASLNLGSLVCIECSGIHRNLGSHISRVRSLDLDEWPPWHIKVMLSIGNAMANSIYEENTRGLAKPTPNSSREEKERWIRSKYERKDFLRPLPPGTPLVQQLVDSICKSDTKSTVYLLAHSTPEHVNTPVGGRDMRIPLHFAAALGNVSATQMLLWNNSNVKAMDQEGRTALTFARLSGSTEVQELLVQNGCPESQAPVSGTLPRRKGSIGRNNPEVFDKLPASVI